MCYNTNLKIYRFSGTCMYMYLYSLLAFLAYHSIGAFFTFVTLESCDTICTL